MTFFTKTEVIGQLPLVLVFLVLAILAYRSKRTIALLLLMLASISYTLLRFAPYAIGLFLSSRGWKTESIVHWLKSSWPWVSQAFSFSFLAFIIAALVFLIRERKEIAHSTPNQTMQPTASPRTASLSDD